MREILASSALRLTPILPRTKIYLATQSDYSMTHPLPPLGHAGPESLLIAAGKVAACRMSSIGLTPSPRRHLELAEALRKGPSNSSGMRGLWKVGIEINDREGWGVVVVSHLLPSGHWMPQDAPDGSPACSFIERGVDPSGLHDEYYYLGRTLHQSAGKRWDPSPSSPAEVSRREDGTIAWTRRFLRDLPADRGEDLPALQCFWSTGFPKVVRRSSVSLEDSSSSLPIYAEFYPDGTPAVEVFSRFLLRAHFPGGQVVERKNWFHPAVNTCARIFASTTAVDFDSFNFSPHSTFLDQFPDGSWRLHKCLHPEKPSPSRRYPQDPMPLPRPTSGLTPTSSPPAARRLFPVPSKPSKL